MGSLIDRHLTLQRLSNADFAPRFSLTQPRHIAEESLRHAQALFVGRVFEPDYAAGLPAVAALDQELVRMGLENLLINAAKYSPDSGAIALDVFADTALHFRVRDSGPGIRPEQRSRLSALFNRMQQTSFKDGFGIGLAIARRVAHAHGGSLDYADRAGGGAVFTLSLPLRQ
jgi:signal transduction histidine kinase